jgi:hypothetical protein
MLRVLSAPIIRSTIKTADAIIGTVHVSVWLKSVEIYIYIYRERERERGSYFVDSRIG